MPLAARHVIDEALVYLSEIWNMDLGQPVQAEYNSETFDQSSEADRVQQYLEKRTTKKEKSIEIAVALWSTAANLHKLAKRRIREMRYQISGNS